MMAYYFQSETMAVEHPPKAKTSRCRISRHKKKYWKKGIVVPDYEITCNTNEKKSDETVDISYIPSEDATRYTRRQRAALRKLSENIGEYKQLPLPPPKFPPKKQPKLKQPVERVEPVLPKQKDGYDLWEKDFVPKVNLQYEEAGEHFLRFTKRKLPNRPSTINFKPSLLNAVRLPDPGASYNPTADEYQKYVSKIAVNETNLWKEEERIEKAVKPQFEEFVTHEEKSLEETEGLAIDPRYNFDYSDVDTEDESANEHIDGKVKKVIISDALRKTRKQRRNAEKEKIFLREHRRRKEIERKQHDVYKAKKINKELAQKELLSEKKTLERKRLKFLRKMTTRQRLGRGQFKDEEEPFLLQEELTDSLRLLKPQGNVLSDRMASLQRRNMLPIGGKREKKKLKAKLKRKFVQKRSVAQVVKGSRVI